MKCPFCHKSIQTKPTAIDHINKVHPTELEKTGMDAPQALYYSTHNTLHGKCMCGCGKDTEWNYKTGKPFKVSSDPKCRERLSRKAEVNLYNARGITKTTMMSDMEHQKEMMQHRPTAGKYKFSDGGEVEYLSTLEHNFLKFCDVIMEMRSNMIQSPPETITYYDSKAKRERYYIPDYYLPDYNLLIEIKDGGKHPNSNPVFIEETKYKVRMKDDAMRAQSKYNYIKIVDKNYGPFLETLYKIVELGRDDSPKKHAVVVISESACVTDPVIDTNEDPRYKVDQNQLYLVLTKIPKTDIVTSMSVTNSIMGETTYHVDENGMLTTTNPLNPKYIDENVEIYRYIGNDDNKNKCFTVLDKVVGQNVATDNIIENILTKNDIMYYFNNSLTNNTFRRSDFVLVYICHAESKKGSDVNNGWIYL